MAEVLTLKNLHAGYGEQIVLQGVTATAQAGDVIGLVGLNGAGKTTLLETLLGFNPPSSGTATVLGVANTELGGHAARARIGFVPQLDETLGGLSGTGYLAMLASFYGSWDVQLAQRLCAEWSVALDKQVSAMSPGERQKLAIVAALAPEPELLVLDEPVASLDPVARRLFLAELVALTHDRGCTVLFSTHIISDLERVASRLWLLKAGTLVLDEPLDALKERVIKVTGAPPDHLDGAQVLHHHEANGNHEWVLSGCGPALAERLASFGAQLWHLDLEEIFLELHR